MRDCATCDGVEAGWDCSISATRPATWGVAIEVPLSVAVAVVPVCQAEVTPLPGANRSRQVPVMA